MNILLQKCTGKTTFTVSCMLINITFTYALYM